MAAIEGHPAIVQALLNRKANAKIQNKVGKQSNVLYLVNHFYSHRKEGHTAFEEAKRAKMTVTMTMLEEKVCCIIIVIVSTIVLRSMFFPFKIQSDYQIAWGACYSGDLDTLRGHIGHVDLDLEHSLFVRHYFLS